MKTAQINNLRIKLKIALGTSLLSYAALMLLIAAGNIFTPDGSVKYWLLQSIPLLIFVPGILKRRFRTYSWICFVVLIYFIHYADKLSTDPGSIINWIGIFLTVMLFNGAMFTSRWMQYFTLEQEQEQEQSSAEKDD